MSEIGQSFAYKIRIEELHKLNTTLIEINDFMNNIKDQNIKFIQFTAEKCDELLYNPDVSKLNDVMQYKATLIRARNEERDKLLNNYRLPADLLQYEDKFVNEADFIHTLEILMMGLYINKIKMSRDSVANEYNIRRIKQFTDDLISVGFNLT